MPGAPGAPELLLQGADGAREAQRQRAVQAFREPAARPGGGGGSKWEDCRKNEGGSAWEKGGGLEKRRGIGGPKLVVVLLVFPVSPPKV